MLVGYCIQFIPRTVPQDVLEDSASEQEEESEKQRNNEEEEEETNAQLAQTEVDIAALRAEYERTNTQLTDIKAEMAALRAEYGKVERELEPILTYAGSKPRMLSGTRCEVRVRQARVAIKEFREMLLNVRVS